jgi:hypothetical protein
MNEQNPLRIYDIAENIFDKYYIFPLALAEVNLVWRAVATRRAKIYLQTRFGKLQKKYINFLIIHLGISNKSSKESWKIFVNYLRNGILPEISTEQLIAV